MKSIWEKTEILYSLVVIGLLFLSADSITLAQVCPEPAKTQGVAPLDTHVTWASFADPEWIIQANGPWWKDVDDVHPLFAVPFVDIRDMLHFFHPLLPSVQGAAASASKEFTIPEDWDPNKRFKLRFFCADDYYADRNYVPPKDPNGEPIIPAFLESFFGHRFKQVLIDGRLIWDRDVIDNDLPADPTAQTEFNLDITDYVTPGLPFTLKFQVLDMVSSSTPMPGDIWWKSPSTSPPNSPLFHTAVWFADPIIGEEQAVNEAVWPCTRPHELAAEARHNARLPITPLGEPSSNPANLKLVTPTPIPAPGFPITCGIPVPPGLLIDPGAVGLTDNAGQELPVQTKVTGWWPDQSIRWLLVNTIAPAGAFPDEQFQLHFNQTSITTPLDPVQLNQGAQGLTVTNGALRIELGQDPQKLIDSVYLVGKESPAMTDLRARMSIRLNGTPTPVNATWQGPPEIIESGPVAAQIELHGSLDTAQGHIGRFTFRLYVYAGLPTVQTNFRIFNDLKPNESLDYCLDPNTHCPCPSVNPYFMNVTFEDLPTWGDVRDLALVANLASFPPNNAVSIGIVDGVPLEASAASVRLMQDRQDHFAATADGVSWPSGQRAQGWIAASGDFGDVQASLWRFWQQYPKSLAVSGNVLEIGLCTPPPGTLGYSPRWGEAKRHDIWFTFSEDLETSRQSLGLLADEPPRLFDSQWFCLSGGINVLDPDWFSTPENRPLADWSGKYGDISTANVEGQDLIWGHFPPEYIFGIRNFGDLPFNYLPQDPGTWTTRSYDNGYWSLVQGTLNWGLASGDQRWVQRSFEIARHSADIDTVHVDPVDIDDPYFKLWNGVNPSHKHLDHNAHNIQAMWPAFQHGDSMVLHYWMTGDPDSLSAAVANADWIIGNNDYMCNWPAGLGLYGRNQTGPMQTLLRVWQATGEEVYRDLAKQYLDKGRQTQEFKLIDWRRGAQPVPLYRSFNVLYPWIISLYAEQIYDYYRLTGDLDAAQMVVAIADSVYAESMLPQEEGTGDFLIGPFDNRSSLYNVPMSLLFYMAYDLTDDMKFLRAGRAAFLRYLLLFDNSSLPAYQQVGSFGWLEPELGWWMKRFENVHIDPPLNITEQTLFPDPANFCACGYQGCGYRPPSCIDKDGDFYVNEGPQCWHLEQDCNDDPLNDPDPNFCATCGCGDVDCGPCARCIHPGATEVCDGVDNNCDGQIDEEPAASNSCQNGNLCDGQEYCSAGSCHPGTPLNCDDGNACTSDSCDPATGCVHTLLSCDDGNLCTDDTCNPSTGCLHTPNTAPCDDGNACTRGDICSGGVCVGGPAVTCDDGNACTNDTCDPATGCVHTPVTCNDDNACTADTCNPATGCVFSPINCNDNNACTNDTCDPATGCVHTLVTCDDGNACTSDTCDLGTGCGHAPISCDDGNACTNDACDPATGCTHQCTVTASGDPCCVDPACLNEPICKQNPPWGTPASTIGIGTGAKTLSDVVNYLLLGMIPLGAVRLWKGLRPKK